MTIYECVVFSLGEVEVYKDGLIGSMYTNWLNLMEERLETSSATFPSVERDVIFHGMLEGTNQNYSVIQLCKHYKEMGPDMTDS